MLTDVWVSQYFEPEKLSYLPLKHYIGGKSLTFDYLRRCEVAAVYELIQEGAKYEDNVGIDEYENQAMLEDELRYCQAFSVKENGRLVGCLFIGPSYLTRSLSPCLCQFHIFLGHELFTAAGVYAEVAGVGERLARDTRLRFFVASVLVFAVHWEVIRDLRRAGYQTSACFPHTGRLKSSGYQQTWLLTKQIDEYMELRHMADIHTTAETKYQAEPQPLRDDVLPCAYYFKCGIYTTLRWIEMQEMETFHRVFMQAMKSSHGYGADEYLTYSMFLRYQVNEMYSMVIEEEKTGRLLGIVTGGRQHRVRGRTPYLASASLLISPEMRGKGIASELMTVWPSLLKRLGFRHLVSDTAMVNTRMRRLEYAGGFTTTGVVPYGVYMANEGWTDVVMSIKDLTVLPEFSDVIHESHERWKADQQSQ